MTRRLSAEAFAFAPLDEMALKGRTESIEAWRLERELPERPRMHGGEARLVGRHARARNRWSRRSRKPATAAA